MKFHVAVTTALLIVFGGSWVVAANSSGDQKRGQVIYELLCLRCHGDKLDGKGPDAGLQSAPPANLLSLSSRIKSDWELFVIIAHGVMFTPMHGYRDLLSEQDTHDVLSYIRTMAPFKPIT